MAVADLMVSALGQPLLIVFWGLQLSDECNEPVSETFRLIGNMSCSASVLHSCFISIDRCILIVRPLDCKSIRTRKRFKLALVIVWTVPVVYGVLRMTVSKKATSYFTVLAAALCYLIIISCYTLIILKIWNRNTETLKGSVRSHGRQSASRLVERRVTATVAIVVVVFTICWIPLMYLRAACRCGVQLGKNTGFEQFSNESVDLLFPHVRISCRVQKITEVWHGTFQAWHRRPGGCQQSSVQ